jgi:hypothetical protein
MLIMSFDVTQYFKIIHYHTEKLKQIVLPFLTQRQVLHFSNISEFRDRSMCIPHIYILHICVLKYEETYSAYLCEETK